MESAASVSVAGYGVHSSKIMQMSLSRSACTRMAISGFSSMRSPLIGLWNTTPCSEILRISPRLNT